MQTPTPSIIGRNALITLGGIPRVPAKVDTGADSSSVWATDISEKNHALYFKLFGDDYPYYTGEEIIAEAGTYEQVLVASSNGERQHRFAVTLPVTIDDKH